MQHETKKIQTSNSNTGTPMSTVSTSVLSSNPNKSKSYIAGTKVTDQKDVHMSLEKCPGLHLKKNGKRKCKVCNKMKIHLPTKGAPQATPKLPLLTPRSRKNLESRHDDVFWFLFLFSVFYETISGLLRSKSQATHA